MIPSIAFMGGQKGFLLPFSAAEKVIKSNPLTVLVASQMAPGTS